MGTAARGGRGAEPDDSPGPGNYSPERLGAHRSPGWKISQSSGSLKRADDDNLPGPGHYFDTEAGEAYSEITRFSQKTLAKKSEEWAKRSGRVSTSPRLVDNAGTWN